MIESFGQILSASNTAVSCRALLGPETEQGLKSGHGLVTPICGEKQTHQGKPGVARG